MCHEPPHRQFTSKQFELTFLFFAEKHEMKSDHMFDFVFVSHERKVEMDEFAQKWSKMVQNGSKWSKKVQNGPKWFKMVQNGPK